ncbi:ribonuclease Y [bacterium]|nr:MAG: ribonuclease Y [bacterium]
MQGLYYILALVLGTVCGYFVRQIMAKRKADSAEATVDKLLTDTKLEVKEILLEAKSNAAKTLEEAKKDEKQRQDQIMRFEQRIERREKELDQKDADMDEEKKVQLKKIEKIKLVESQIEGIKVEREKKLQEMAEMTKVEAKEMLFEETEQNYKEDLLKRITDIERDGKEQFDARAKDIMALAMQRYAAGHAADTTTTSLTIPNDEVKGKIIGKEGRNIKALEHLTGVEIIVDDTPGVVVISGFDPLRRYTAKLALERLIADGRIHPAKIEEVIEKVKGEIAAKVKEAGEAAIYDIGITGVNPKLIQLIGRLRFRTSYGQNALLHSLEVAHLAGSIATELGADVEVVKWAGMFHDIGKAIDREVEGTHVEIGRTILKKFGVSETIIKAMQSHHEDYPFESLEAVIIHVADVLSASRPGARKDTLENYLKRLEELEGITAEFDGVEKAYAIQAGRELRVFVTPQKIDDLSAKKMAKSIATRIQEELKYPGEIKVTVIRETRVIEYAK